MGISAFSDKVNVWEEHRGLKWLLKLAEDQTVSDEQFIETVKNHGKRREAFMAYLKEQRMAQILAARRDR